MAVETPASREDKPDNIKGVCACASTQRLYFTTTKKLYCVDLATEKTLWETTPPNGTDRMSITPDGQTIYVPSFEKDTWNVIDAAIKSVERASDMPRHSPPPQYSSPPPSAPPSTPRTEVKPAPDAEEDK